MNNAPLSRLSLKARLGLGAVLLGLVNLVTVCVLLWAMNTVSSRLDTALASENRMARYASLSTQAATFLVVATEAIQTGLSPDIRAERIAPVQNQMRRTFEQLRADVEAAVISAQSLGLDAQSRFGTQSLGLARMEAMLNNTVKGLTTATDNRPRLRAHVDTFASNFDPLLSQAVNTEVLFRNAALEGIQTLRRTLVWSAFVIGIATCLAVLAFHFGLIAPQFRRLDRLRGAAHQIAEEDFAVDLGDERPDEIGELALETRRMAAALAERKAFVQSEWARLNDTIAARTAELQRVNARLEEIDENRRRFFADVSHELRTPLTVILMEAQLGKQGSGESAEAFATIETRAARLNRRIDDLLRVARSDSGQIALEPERVALASLIDFVAEEVRAEIDNAGMQLMVSVESAGSVTLDVNWMRQVLVSLIRNAITHARSGGFVALSAENQNGCIMLSVTDNGPGIAQADQAKVFDRFVQGKDGNAQGFGIGLALARWVVEEHGGWMTLVSPLPRGEELGAASGTRVSVFLPNT